MPNEEKQPFTSADIHNGKRPSCSNLFNLKIYENMPANKNAVLRYKYIDELLSDSHHLYNMDDLLKAVNLRLEINGNKPIAVRTLQLDLNAMQNEVFNAPIEKFTFDKTICYRYSEPGYSIFHKPLSKEETNLLGEVLSTIGQFEGLPHFAWLDNLQKGLGIKENRKIIDFSKNVALKNIQFLGMLYDVISNNQVLELSYKKFSAAEPECFEFHPYSLKEYNSRWYLVGYDSDRECIKTLPVDRITEFTPLPEKKLIPCPVDINSFFDNVVGITVYADKEPIDILLWASEHETDYIDTKPIHHSQEKIEDKNLIAELQATYHKTNGHFYTLRCQQTYELEREFVSHFAEVEVLQPVVLRECIIDKIKGMAKLYELR